MFPGLKSEELTYAHRKQYSICLVLMGSLGCLNELSFLALDFLEDGKGL
jgi:hypothetical protein